MDLCFGDTWSFGKGTSQQSYSTILWLGQSSGLQGQGHIQQNLVEGTIHNLIGAGFLQGQNWDRSMTEQGVWLKVLINEENCEKTDSEFLKEIYDKVDFTN